MDVSNEQRSHWAAERRWLIGIFILIAGNIGVGLIWAGSVDRRIVFLEEQRRYESVQSADTRSELNNIQVRIAVSDNIMTQTRSDISGLRDDIRDLSDLLRQIQRGNP